MSATNPDQSPTPHLFPSTTPAGSDQPHWLHWFTPQIGRMILWLGLATLGTYAMGSAANHLFSGSPKDQDANVANASATSGGDGASRRGTWWNPATDSIETSSVASGVTTEAGAPSSDGNSIIPVERNPGFTSGSLIVNGGVPIGSNNSRAAYDVLGLGTRSFTASSMGGPFTMSSANSSELHFSLGGDLTLVPTDNLAAGGVSVTTLVAAPEPSSGGLLAVGLAGLTFWRRRQSKAIA